MKQFKEGFQYTARSACDHNCVFTITILSRTDKTVAYTQDNRTRRSKIHTDHNGEFVIPDQYSMAPVFRAMSEVMHTRPTLTLIKSPA